MYYFQKLSKIKKHVYCLFTVWMILEHFDMTVSCWQNSIIKKTCGFIELGTLKSPLVIFKTDTAFQNNKTNIFS